MKERIIEFLRAENKSSAQFAEEIGVQPSGISHIISGRNNPSLDFILKMLERYKFVSTDWLLFGKGSMYKDGEMQTLFPKEIIEQELDFNNPVSKQDVAPVSPNNELFADKKIEFNKEETAVEKIVWFFSDNSFIEYYPRKRNS